MPAYIGLVGAGVARSVRLEGLPMLAGCDSSIVESDGVRGALGFVRRCCKADGAVIAGFGSYIAWMTIGITPSLCDASIRAVVAHLNNQELLGRMVGIVPLLILAIFALRDWRKKERVRLALWGTVASVVISLCTAALYLTYFLQQPSRDVSVAMGFYAVAAVAASAVLLVAWGTRACTFSDRRRTLFCLATAHIVGFGTMLVVSFLPASLQVLVHIGAPIASCGFFRLDDCREGQRDGAVAPPVDGQISARTGSNGLSSQTWRLSSLMRSFVGLAFFAAIMECLFIISDSKSSNPDELTWIIAGLCVCGFFVGLSSVAASRHRRIAMESLSRWVMPCFVLGDFLVFSSTASQGMPEVFTMGCAWVFFRLFYWTTWGNQALSSPYPVVPVIILGRILLVCGSVVGSLALALMQMWDISEFTALALLCVAAIAVSLACFGEKVGSPEERRAFDAQDRRQCESCADEATRQFGLTEKEREIAVMLASGLSNDEIRDCLVVSESTVRTHLRNMRKKTETHSRTELVVLLRSLF